MEDGKPAVWIVRLAVGVGVEIAIGGLNSSFLWPGVIVRMLSFDAAVHSSLGSLSKGDTLDRLLRLARQGVIAGCLTGPPCETWSAARHLILDGLFGPRPLRSAALPRCLPERSAREMRQCETGTPLMDNSWRMEAAVTRSGGGSIQEHPWENFCEDRASVWPTTVHTHSGLWPCLMRVGIELIRISMVPQGSSLPTCLKALNLEEPGVVEAALRDGAAMWRCRPLTKLQGRTPAGDFRTASAKEYPVALCRTLLVALLKGLRQRGATEGLREPTVLSTVDQQWLQNVLSTSASFSAGTFLPDYQGT